LQAGKQTKEKAAGQAEKEEPTRPDASLMLRPALKGRGDGKALGIGG
jgi:hypothetical protein